MTFIARERPSPEARRAAGERAPKDARAARGYLLEYHKLLCTYDPDLMAAYEGFYRHLTLLERSLTYFEREVIWLVLLVVTREAYGDHHIPRAKEAGLSAEQIHGCMALAGVAEAFPALEFAKAWKDWISAERLEQHYAAMVAAARGTIPEQTVEMAMAVAQAARKCAPGMRFHIRRANALGAPVEKLAEGFSYIILTSGGPALVDACDMWADFAREGGCPPPWPLD